MNLIVLTVVLVKPAAVNESAVISSPAASVALPPPSSKPAATIRTPVRKQEPLPTAEENTQVIQPEPAAEAVKIEPVIRHTTPAGIETQLTFNDLRASGNLNLPDLNIDIHVFSEKPADRFVL